MVFTKVGNGEKTPLMSAKLFISKDRKVLFETQQRLLKKIWGLYGKNHVFVKVRTKSFGCFGCSDEASRPMLKNNRVFLLGLSFFVLVLYFAFPASSVPSSYCLFTMFFLFEKTPVVLAGEKHRLVLVQDGCRKHTFCLLGHGWKTHYEHHWSWENICRWT